MPPGKTGSTAAPRRAGSGQGRGRHVQAGTSVQRGGAGYYSGGGTRTVTTSGGRRVSARGRGVRYETPGGQRVALTVVPSRTYHRIILAEFVVCVVLIAASPVLGPRPQGSTAAGPVSLAAPLVRLTAVCVVFFVLALMGAGARSGKAAAAFGGLVTLGTLLNATPVITGLTAAFTGTPAGGAPADAEAGEPLPASLTQQEG